MAASDSSGSAAVKLLAENDVKTFLDACDVLIKICTNILSDPENDKFRRMRIANKTLSNKLLPVDGGFQCLFEMGFQEVSKFLALSLQGDTCLNTIPTKWSTVYTYRCSQRHG